MTHLPSPPFKQPLIIEYTNLLHQYRDTEAADVKAFFNQHADDPVFLKRVEVLNKAFKLKADLTGADIDRAIKKDDQNGCGR